MTTSRKTRVHRYRAHFNKGDVLIEEGTIGREMYILEQGKVDILIGGRRVNTITSEDGQEVVGEIGAIEATPRTATVVAATHCQAIVVPFLELEKALKSAPSIGVMLVRSLCRKVINATRLQLLGAPPGDSVLRSGDVDRSIEQYMKGFLHLLQEASGAGATSGLSEALDYFVSSNPWGIEQGDPAQVVPIEEADSAGIVEEEEDEPDGGN